MKDEEILKKAIEKAVKNGFDIRENINELNCVDDGGAIIVVRRVNGLLYAEANTIIFNHDFAKAFWGEEYYEVKNGIKLLVTDATQIQHGVIWQHHIQEMALEKEPIKYLEQFL